MRNIKIKTLLIMLLGCLYITNLQANELADTLQSRLETYNLEKPTINLYVHLDRNTYTPEDTIWFKAYLFAPIRNEVLYVRITDRKKNKVLEKQFPMYDIRAHGEISLPDTLSEGKYYFYAYTDQMISLNPNDVFVQPITVTKVIASRLEAEASVTNQKKVHRGDNVEIRTFVKSTNGKNIKGNFSLWVGERLLKQGYLTTNKNGEAFVRFKYPQIDDTEMVRCEIRFKQDKEFAELILNLRHEGNTAKVKAYAEGGHFLEGFSNHAVLEVFDDNKNPLEVPVDLLENKRIIAETKTNKQGIGSVHFIPHANTQYSLAIHENDTVTIQPFPGVIETKGYGLKVETKDGQTSALITNCNNSDSATLVLRTMDKVIWSQPVSINKGDSARINIPAQEYPKSLLNLAVFNGTVLPKADSVEALTGESQVSDSPVSPGVERLFINKTEDPYKVRISTSKTTRKGLTSIKVNLSVTDSGNRPVNANLSVSIVEKSTLDKSSYRTITQSYYLKDLFSSRSAIHDEHDPYFNNQLISMNCGLKDWQHILRYKPTGVIRILENTGGVNGQVISKSKSPIKLESLMLESSTSADRNDIIPMISVLNGGRGLQQNTTNRPGRIKYVVKEWAESVPIKSNGSFSIPYKSLLVNPNETKILLTGLFFSNDYDVRLTDYAEEMDEFVHDGEALNFKQPVNTFTKYEAPAIKVLSNVIQLKEVTVETKGKFMVTNKNIGKKEDYVCREFNVFNCPNHRTGGYKPRVGMVYASRERGDLFIYNGVGQPFTPAPEGAAAGSTQYLLIKNISKPKTFYNPASTDTTFLKGETRTTIYWSPNIYIDETGKTTFNCNISDRSGDFTIIVQGLEVKTRKPVFGTIDVKF
jgi:hypothetical protein